MKDLASADGDQRPNLGHSRPAALVLKANMNRSGRQAVNRRGAFKNMNSDRALLLVLWTVCAGFVVAFAAGWQDHFSDVFRPGSYHDLTSFITFWIVLFAPYPLVFVLPPLRKPRKRTEG